MRSHVSSLRAQRVVKDGLSRSVQQRMASAGIHRRARSGMRGPAVTWPSMPKPLLCAFQIHRWEQWLGEDADVRCARCYRRAHGTQLAQR